ncbi:PalH/RIM21 [Geosmithia morbida]|uniref:PalH/RIM21 n=1 Tax=Geosmithia morbida TaxID=1094350 RepID=A0A9P4YW72_9HYPO|nr:PalH/RIM21 [Geosmithia morbida]KAF4123145.1 PalH/RIM21 [Geosmithia morbida]
MTTTAMATAMAAATAPLTSTICAGGAAAMTTLPVNAVLYLGDGWEPYTLTQQGVYEVPACRTLAVRDSPPTSSTTTSTPLADSSLSSSDDDDSHHFSDFRNPFYATQFPMCYALAATTITAYMLVIILFVTPRTFVDGGTLRLGGRGALTGRGTGSDKIGGRPWLQKVAALTVAISLTVATADTFRVAQQQYSWGIQNAKSMQQEVIGSNELKAIRLISDTFLWLAQAQTLIRIFPRQREKVLIKWVAFALITLDVIFTALNSWKYSDDGVSAPSNDNTFVHPVPAFSYLFQLALGILYAVWVLYYSLTKRRYAFYHPAMRNICVIAVLAIGSVIMPIVFFILDISKPGFAGWGDYVRWVGAAAASVVVWEWVERIEALERDEKRDGILGREVFDGDDTLEVNASDYPWLRKNDHRVSGSGSRDDDGEDGGGGGGGSGHLIQSANRGSGGGGGGGGGGGPSGSSAWPHSMSPGYQNGPPDGSQRIMAMSNILRPHMWPSRPAPVATPISRTDTGSAASTVYADLQDQQGDESPSPHEHPKHESSLSPGRTRASGSRWTVRARLEVFAANQAERIRERMRPTTDTDSLPVTIIPAPARQGTALQQVLEEEGEAGGGGADGDVDGARRRRRARRGGSRSRSRSPSGSHNDGGGTSSHRGSVEMAQLEGSRSRSGTSHSGPDGLPAGQPPLWPGVQSRLMYGDDDYSSYDGASVTDTLSTEDERRDGEGSRA